MAKPLTDSIEHVVVLMLENRSFDNVLGGLYPELTHQGIYRGLLGDETIPLDPANPRAGSVSVFQGDADLSTWIMPYPDPGEDFSNMVRQIFGSDSSMLSSGVLPPMSGFAWDYGGQPASPPGPGWPSRNAVPADIMQYYSAAALPVTSYLAKSYAVCDCWFAAAPVQTLANRILTHCGTPSKVPVPIGSNWSRVNNPDYTANLHATPPFNPPVKDTTIFELLDKGSTDGKPTWKVYFHDAPLSALCHYVYQHWDFQTYDSGNVYHFHTELGFGEDTNFEYDIKNGQLPKYSFIEPSYTWFFTGVANSNHPGGSVFNLGDPNGAYFPPPVNVMDGERLLWLVYSILLKYPETFAKTLLIVTYDEHGGLFDHVAPPQAVSPFHPPVRNFNYDRYGVRVPALLINPSIPPGTIYPGRSASSGTTTAGKAGKSRARFPPLPDPPFDHTSILSTLIAQFDLPGPLTPRVTSAPPLAGLITDKTYLRPACLSPPAAAASVARREPPLVTDVPTQAPTLAGALLALYRVQQSAKRPSAKRPAAKRPSAKKRPAAKGPAAKRPAAPKRPAAKRPPTKPSPPKRSPSKGSSSKRRPSK